MKVSDWLLKYIEKGGEMGGKRKKENSNRPRALEKMCRFAEDMN